MAGTSLDLSEAIERLYAQRASLMRAISAIEALLRDSTIGAAGAGRSKRGRKSMNSEERQEVSQRMKKYWASRRSSNGGPEASSM
jgi:hypothetical protein